MRIVIFTLFLLFISPLLTAQNSDPKLNNSINADLGKRIQIDSSRLGEKRELLIHIPDGYHQSRQQYPVLYLLDGNRHFHHATTAVGILAQEGLVPASIIVGITNNPGTRGRDLSAEPEKFLDFIQHEVIHYMQSHYRTARFKTLFGHSMAGAFALKAFADEPTSFNNYIAASPVLQIYGSEVLAKTSQLFEKQKEFEQSLFLSLTDIEGEGAEATDALNQYVKMMKAKSPQSLFWEYHFISSQTHMTTPYLTLFKGLTRVFDDYNAPRITSFDVYQQQGGMKGLKAFYQQRSEKYQVSPDIPESSVRRMGFELMEDSPNEALEILRTNSKNHPDSPGALFAMGRAFENVKDSRSALQAYENALTLAKEKQADSVAFLTGQVERYRKLTSD